MESWIVWLIVAAVLGVAEAGHHDASLRPHRGRGRWWRPWSGRSVSACLCTVMCRTWNWPDRRTWTGSLGSMDANHEATCYPSEYGLW